MPTPPRTVWLAIGFLGVAFYWFVFLSQPLVEGTEGVTRGLYVLSALVYPEGHLSGWTDNSRLPLGFADRLPVLIATGLWLVAATLIGGPLCRPMALEQVLHVPSVSQKLVWLSLACLVGLALLSTLTLLVGLFGGLKTGWVLPTGVVVLLIVSGNALRKPWMRGLPSPQPERPVEAVANPTLFERVIGNTIIVLTVWLGLITMLGAWVPPFEFDVVEYHLQAPKEFFETGKIGFVPHNIYANMPLGAEMHSLAAMALWSDPDTWLGGLIGKSITAATTVVGAIFLGAWLAQRLGSCGGWAAAGIWLGTPGITHVATLGLIDGVVATYVLATVLVTWQARIANQPALWLLACLLAGATAALKYPGLILATLPCLGLAGLRCIHLVRQGAGRPAGKLAMAALLGLSVTCLPWYGKNWALAGNPVYPLAADLFGGRTLTSEKIAQWQQAHRVPSAAAKDATAVGSLRGATEQLVRDLARVGMTSLFVQPAMICGLLWAIIELWPRRKSGEPDRDAQTAELSIIRCLLVWSLWILGVWWLATHRIDRFWLPLTGLWAALAAWGVCRIHARSPALAHTLLLTGLFYAAIICSSRAIADCRYFVALASLRDDMGDQENLPRVPLIQTWINQNLSATDRVLLIGEARVFEYRVPVVYSTCFDTNPGETWLAGKGPQQQRHALADAGITHVMVNWSEIDRYRSPGNYGFSDWPQPKHIEQLVRDRVLQSIDWADGTERTQLFEVLVQ